MRAHAAGMTISAQAQPLRHFCGLIETALPSALIETAPPSVAHHPTTGGAKPAAKKPPAKSAAKPATRKPTAKKAPQPKADDSA